MIGVRGHRLEGCTGMLQNIFTYVSISPRINSFRGSVHTNLCNQLVLGKDKSRLFHAAIILALSTKTQGISAVELSFIFALTAVHAFWTEMPEPRHPVSIVHCCRCFTIPVSWNFPYSCRRLIAPGDKKERGILVQERKARAVHVEE